jgi:hypothetical protein
VITMATANTIPSAANEALLIAIAVLVGMVVLCLLWGVAARCRRSVYCIGIEVTYCSPLRRVLMYPTVYSHWRLSKSTMTSPVHSPAHSHECSSPGSPRSSSIASELRLSENSLSKDSELSQVSNKRPTNHLTMEPWQPLSHVPSDSDSDTLDVHLHSATTPKSKI